MVGYLCYYYINSHESKEKKITVKFLDKVLKIVIKYSGNIFTGKINMKQISELDVWIWSLSLSLLFIEFVPCGNDSV